MMIHNLGFEVQDSVFRRGCRVRFPGEKRRVIWKIGGLLEIELEERPGEVVRQIQLHLVRTDRHNRRRKRTRCLCIRPDQVQALDLRAGGFVYSFADNEHGSSVTSLALRGSKLIEVTC